MPKEEKPLEYAIKIIEAYQSEIVEAGYDKDGFCQGVIFKDAIRRIRELDEIKDPQSCQFCQGTGEVPVMEQVYPGEPHMADTGTQKCVCQLSDESDLE